ncbi:40S ribosomal protein S17 [Vitis vinifera]|uniref:40S ribosomal protein S17 n=2 Tax=Vitis vinifera TaxID=29760 RepID=A0A438BP18_VITVI|nr:40S ribosomal protein S17 [Vitis vinifera]
MGRVRTKTVKKSSRQVIERYYSRMTLDFHTNKKVLEEVAIIPSKRLRNKIAGFSTHLMKRIQKGPVRGISLKLQEEERERRMDFVPDVSAINTDEIPVDKETLDMLAMLGMNDLPGVVKAEPVVVSSQPAFGRSILDRKSLLIGMFYLNGLFYWNVLFIMAIIDVYCYFWFEIRMWFGGT